MCGIYSIKGSDAINKTIQGLKKLEYRGYDSCGVAYKNNNIKILKTKGYVSELDKLLPNASSDISIGHTRWATHGKPSDLNSHPHSSESGKFVCVHNGIIENYKNIKKSLLSDVNFKTMTDTEVIPNLIEYYYNSNNSILESIKRTLINLQGSMAICVLSEYDNNIYFARLASPLVIAKVESDYIICSDINGLPDKSQVFYLPDNSYGVLDTDFHVFDINGTPIDIIYKDYSSEFDKANTNTYKYFMLKEINEIPKAIEVTYDYLSDLKLTLPSDVEHILFVSCGTSYHASLIAKKMIEKYAHIPVDCEIASEYLCDTYLTKPKTLAVFISQSGETADTLKSLALAKSKGMYTLAITNVENSSITHVADSTILMRAGAEICVASTKAYTTQIFVLIVLCGLLQQLKAKNILTQNEFVQLSFKRSDSLFTDQELYNLLSIDINAFSQVLDKIANEIYSTKVIHIIGKDLDYITAMESALKIKEINYIFTDAYPCGELKHGTLSLIEEGSIVFVIITQKENASKTMNALHEVTARGGKVICVTTLDDLDFGKCEYVIKLPKVASIFDPIVSIIPFQLLSYKICLKLGLNPDKPRNLAKSVTVE